MSLPTTDRTKLNNLSPNLVPQQIAVSALRLAVFQEIYTVLDNIINDLNAYQVAGAVKTLNLADGSVLTVKLADGAVTGQKILDGAIITAKMADGGITALKIADSAVTTLKLADYAVTTVKLGDGAVTTAKLADAIITAAKLADGSVTNAKIADGAVTGRTVANGAINSQHMDAALLASAASLSVQAEFDKRGVNVQKYGAKGDGIADDAAALNAAFAAASTTYQNVYIPPGIYSIKSQLLWDGKCAIIGHGNYSVIRADAPMESVIKCSKDNNNLTVNKGFRYGILRGVQLAGNKQAQNCLYIESGKGIKIYDVYASESLDIIFKFGHITDTTLKVWELVVRDCYLNGGAGADRAYYCMHVSTQVTDSTFESIIAVNSRTAIFKFMGAALRVRNLHGYGYPKTESCDYIFLIESANSLYSQLYADTPNIGGIVVNGAYNEISQIFVLFNTIDLAYAVEPFGVRIKASDNRLRDTLVSFVGFSAADANASSCVIVDNSGANIYTVTVSGVSWFTQQPNYVLSLKGKQPDRLDYSGLSNGMIQFVNGQYYFGRTQNAASTTPIVLTFNNQRSSSVYTPIVVCDWNTKTWVTNRTVDGFTVNFSDAPAVTGNVQIRIIDQY